ncbi:aminomethyltransferase beta-barrel domain-containing protein, partial [Arthrospira platensis SPKY2]
CKVRYRAKPQPCTLYPEAGDRVRVRFDQPLRDITPGQGAVFYDGDRALGGGLIAKEGAEAAMPELSLQPVRSGHPAEG